MNHSATRSDQKHHHRGGHYPGHLRYTFRLAAEAWQDWKPGQPEPVVPHVADYAKNEAIDIPVSAACRVVWNCTDTLPGDIAYRLRLDGLDFKNQTYAAAARAILAHIRRMDRTSPLNLII